MPKRKKKKKPPNTEVSVHDNYYMYKGTEVILEEIDPPDLPELELHEATIKNHILNKDITFTTDEFIDYTNGWYTFLKHGWYVKVKRTSVTKDDLNALF